MSTPRSSLEDRLDREEEPVFLPLRARPCNRMYLDAKGTDKHGPGPELGPRQFRRSLGTACRTRRGAGRGLGKPRRAAAARNVLAGSNRGRPPPRADGVDQDRSGIWLARSPPAQD